MIRRWKKLLKEQDNRVNRYTLNMAELKIVSFLMIFQKILALEVIGRKILIKAEQDEFVREAVTACNREGLDFINQNTSYEKHSLLSQQPHEVLLPHAEI